MKNSKEELPKPDAVWRAVSDMAIKAAFYERSFKGGPRPKGLTNEIQGLCNDLTSLVKLSSPKPKRGGRKTDRSNRALSFGELAYRVSTFLDLREEGLSKEAAARKIGSDKRTIGRQIVELDKRRKQLRGGGAEHEMWAEWFVWTYKKLASFLAESLGGKFEGDEAVFLSKGLLNPTSKAKVHVSWPKISKEGSVSTSALLLAIKKRRTGGRVRARGKTEGPHIRLVKDLVR